MNFEWAHRRKLKKCSGVCVHGPVIIHVMYTSIRIPCCPSQACVIIMHKPTKIACINDHRILSIAVKTRWNLNTYQLLTTKSCKSISLQRDRWILIDAIMWVNHLNMVFVERIQVYKSMLCMAHLYNV